ncbi:hypothetical protein HA075_20520 [bacterium BFN5]|nr:hypothetical protein HA075_20520 [bacterium BFN5]
MINDKESWQAEELSLCLDALHEGKQSVSQDQEVQELIDMAVLIQAENPATVPDVLIAEMADVLAIELGKSKRKRRKQWLYGGLAATVAACLIAVFVQFAVIPPVDNYVAQQQNHGDQMQNSSPSISAGQPTREAVPEKARQQDDQIIKSESHQEAKRASQQLLAEIISQPEVREQEKQSDQLALQQPAPDVSARQSTLMAKTTVGEEAGNQTEQKISTILVIPDHKPQSVRIDPAGSMIEQVYHFDSQDEILITQRLHVSSEDQTAGDTQQSKDLPFAKQNQEQPNWITIKIDQYDITIVGKRTSAELQKIAATLIEKKIVQ